MSTWREIKLIGFWRWLWYRTLYRKVMRFAHRHGWHHVVNLGPFDDGSTQRWCQWCGMRDVTKPVTLPPLPKEAGR